MKKTFFIISLLMLALPLSARGPKIIRISDDITAQRIDRRVYVYTATAEIEGFGSVPSNGVIVVKDGEAILLDTPIDDAQTKTLVDWIGEKLRAKVTLFVPNHWHSDCLGGLGYLHSIGVKSYASELTREFAVREGKPIPQQGFADSLTLDLHGTEVRCYYLGGGHAKDNIAVWIPSAKILFGGCMVKSAESTTLGNTSDAVMEEWPATIDTLIRRFPEAKTVVPGHGAWGGPELLVHTRQLLDSPNK